MDIFDHEFPKRFPGVAFTRFINEVFIATRGNDEVIFNKKAGYALLEEVLQNSPIEWKQLVHRLSVKKYYTHPGNPLYYDLCIQLCMRLSGDGR